MSPRWKRRRKKLLLVTGGSGFLGRHLTGMDASGDWEIYAPSSAALDVRDRDNVDDEIRGWEPTAVAHLAYRRDDRRTIVTGSRNVAAAATAAGARLVHVSTDLVFGGRSFPYTEADEPSPVGDYATWKAEAERAVALACPGAAIVRTSLLYGTSVLAPIQHDVEQAVSGRSSMRFFTDEIRCPAHAYDVAAALARIAERPEITGVLHVAGPEAISRADLARRFATWLDLDPARVPVGSVTDFPTPRAAQVVLDVSAARALGITCRPLAAALV